MNIDGMSYREWQKRNSDTFQILTKAQQQSVRQQGYRNVSWQKVQQSWKILQQLKPPSLFDAKLKKGDLPGAIDQSILGAEQVQDLAKQAKSNLKRKRNQIQKRADEVLDKYQLL
ncbi:hypothetical protein [Pseudanabaena sp. FACHB-2040]|uniref:hypothetical protein n=1 Tax=Pseudanabaena sp. FACHB-2040 TaxID=2692859 RepID=UPI00168404A9|nr:hypothetical protein [Pseudanabaena sp. FACHB-2040]MBD2256363.1 hypothetical protein [Pseudanabaena sp. FACHB-2040]